MQVAICTTNDASLLREAVVLLKRKNPGRTLQIAGSLSKH
jgi:hypothetical protein